MKTLFKNFIKCGCIGWCLECFYTGLSALQSHTDPKLKCCSSLWMFPIYGMAAFIRPIGILLKRTNALIRGGVYTIGIFLTEFISGSLLRKYRACPWDYSKARYHYKGLIRFDYAPLWFVVGLLYERFLIPKKERK